MPEDDPEDLRVLSFSLPRLLGHTLRFGLAACLLTVCGFSQTVDTFDPTAGDEVDAIAVQPDGKILVGGIFSTMGSQQRKFLARLERDGALDENFNAQLAYAAVATNTAVTAPFYFRDKDPAAPARFYRAKLK